MKFRKNSKVYKLKRVSKRRFDQIKISNAFKRHSPRPEKLHAKIVDFTLRFHKLSPIIVSEDYILMDGYCAYLIARGCNYRGLRLKIYMAKEIRRDK